MGGGALLCMFVEFCPCLYFVFSIILGAPIEIETLPCGQTQPPNAKDAQHRNLCHLCEFVSAAGTHHDKKDHNPKQRYHTLFIYIYICIYTHPEYLLLAQTEKQFCNFFEGVMDGLLGIFRKFPAQTQGSSEAASQKATT